MLTLASSFADMRIRRKSGVETSCYGSDNRTDDWIRFSVGGATLLVVHDNPMSGIDAVRTRTDTSFAEFGGTVCGETGHDSRHETGHLLSLLRSHSCRHWLRNSCPPRPNQSRESSLNSRPSSTQTNPIALPPRQVFARPCANLGRPVA